MSAPAITRVESRGDGRRTPLAQRRGAAVVWGTLGVLLTALVAELAVRGGVVNESSVPRVTDVVPRFFELLGEAQFWDDVGATVSHGLQGLAIAVVVAVPLGVLLGSVYPLWRALRPTIEFLRPVPPVALVPLVTLLWGGTAKSVVALSAFVAAWPLLIQAIYGVREVDEVARDAASVYGIKGLRRGVRVILPSAMPFVATGLRLAATAALLLAITVELLSGAPGLGQQLAAAQQAGNNTYLYALVLATGLLGAAANIALVRLEGHFLRWSPTYRSTR